MIFDNLFCKKSDEENKRTPSFSVVFNKRFGNYLTDRNGRSLYCSWEFDVEENKYKLNLINRSGNNRLGIWHIFYEENIMVPSAFKKKDFFNIRRPDGLMQTTYKGCPLYYYGNDLNPGDIKGEGINGKWFVVKIKKSDF